MSELAFEWDENKNKRNIIKHGVSFEEASTVFDDINALLFNDPDHSIEEERFLMIGMSVSSRVLIVSHCVRSESIIRIISARKADKQEQRVYFDHIFTGGRNEGTLRH